MRFSWLLVDELAIGSAPKLRQDCLLLKQEGIRGVFSLCTGEEAPPPRDLLIQFQYLRFPLPDHQTGRPPRVEELEQAVIMLQSLQTFKPIFLHCAAGIERSPLVAIAWLIHSRGLSSTSALDYLQQVHPGSSPLADQLLVLRRCQFGKVPDADCLSVAEFAA